MTNIIISESQIHVLREFENNEVLHGEFETKVRNYMNELQKNPTKPNFDDFFRKNNISEVELQNKMLDLGLISKSDNITEPEDAEGKKHSVHTRKFRFFNKNFNDNIDKLYDTFFKNGQRKAINEEGEGGAAFGGGALGGGNLMAGSSDESGGVTYAFGGKNNVQRRPSYNSQRKKTGDVTKQDSNIDMSDAMDRTPGKIAMNRKK